MPVTAKVEPFDKDIAIIISEELSPAAASRVFAEFAQEKIGEADEINRSVLGRIPPRRTYVDGSESSNFSAVRPDGVIVAEWQLIADVMIWIGETLRERSPHRSGNYQKAHTLFADGIEVPVGKNIPEAEEYVFLNPLPYARKIEAGKTKGGRDFVMQVPNRIYERTANDAKARFGNLVRVKFAYRGAENSNIVQYVKIKRIIKRRKNGRFMSSPGEGDNAAAEHERSLRVPAIIVTVK